MPDTVAIRTGQAVFCLNSLMIHVTESGSCSPCQHNTSKSTVPRTPGLTALSAQWFASIWDLCFWFLVFRVSTATYCNRGAVQQTIPITLPGPESLRFLHSNNSSPLNSEKSSNFSLPFSLSPTQSQDWKRPRPAYASRRDECPVSLPAPVGVKPKPLRSRRNSGCRRTLCSVTVCCNLSLPDYPNPTPIRDLICTVSTNG